MIDGRDQAQQVTPSPVPPLKVCLLLESRLSREALSRILRRFPDIAVVTEGSAGEDPHSVIAASQCNVLVMDTADPKRLHGLLHSQFNSESSFKVLLIGMDSDNEGFLGAVRAGVTGYLLKDASASEILVAIRMLARGEAHCPPRLCLSLFQYIAQQHRTVMPRGSTSTNPSLTLRQQKLVQLVAHGLTNKEIAVQLHLSEFTVRNHIHRIMRRVKATNRREVVEAVNPLQKQLRQVPKEAAADLILEIETHARIPQPQRAQERFRPVVQALQTATGASSETVRYKGGLR